MVVKIILAGVAASIIWFAVGGALYMNPLVAGIYKKFKSSPGIKKWENTKSYLLYMYLLILAQCLLFAGVYVLIKPALPGTVLISGLVFGLILTAVKILPRFFDMWVQSTYPNTLLGIEIINGIIGSFVMALTIAFMIKWVNT